MQARPDSATAPVDSLCVDSLSANSRPVERLVLSADDDVLLDALQRAAFSYFLEQVDPVNGLVADTSRPARRSASRWSDFALSAYPIAVERGWMTRQEAVRAPSPRCVSSATAIKAEPTHRLQGLLLPLPRDPQRANGCGGGSCR